LAEWKPHSDKQERAVFSDKKITLCGAGIQWGKSRVGAIRMKIAMHTYTHPDDTFIIAAPTYKIMNQSTLPAFKAVMADYWDGNYNDSKAEFKMPGGGTCYFRTGTDPDSVVGVTNCRHIWGDEAGKFSLYFWENLQARGSFKEAAITLTTSPYSLNWIFKEIIKPLRRNPMARPDVLYVKARSDENPYFPKAEYERKRATMDPRRFKMVYGGEFDKMEGLVYSEFDEVENICDAFQLPSGTRYIAGVDWGYTHPFVIVVRAITPTGQHYQVSEFYKTQLTIAQKIEAAKRMKAVFDIERFYCDPARPDDIAAFNQAKLTAIGADNTINIGIERHLELIKTRRYKIFRGTSPFTEDELESYHWPSPDDDLDPDDDDKEQKPVDKDNHALDANRYVSLMTWQGHKRNVARVASETPKDEDQHARIERLKKRRVGGHGNFEDWG
jgi:PBSX family phage terminase large subunit